MAYAVPRPASRRESCPLLTALELKQSRPSVDGATSPTTPVQRSQSLQHFNVEATVSAAPDRCGIRESVSEAPVLPEKEDPTPRETHRTNEFTRTPEEERFERMMERFQLRRMSISSGSPTSVARMGSRRNSMDNTMQGATARTERHGSKSRYMAPNSAVESPMETDPSSGVLDKIVLVSKFRQQTDAAKELWVWVQGMGTSPFTATCAATRLRLGVLVAVFVGKLLYTPFAIAYADYDDWASIVDAIVVAVCVLNIIATCNTETTNAQRLPVTTRRTIWRYYRRNGLSTDLLAALPLERLLMLVSQSDIVHWFVGALSLVLLNASLTRHLRLFHAAWSKEVMASDTSASAGILFSRYGHLVRIGRIIAFIVVVAHYFACMWSWLHVAIDADFFVVDDVTAIHMNSLYVALQLLQGQGVETKTPAQALFGSVAVLLGSIALAVMFGNVAILVANFSANATAYQRRMERVFAVMGKLELPHPIRERVHQYYEYLHNEYELLDGEIVKFAKDLSHTLTLETVLFRFMEVLVNVPHWHSCSPDFQKQLVLSLSVRIYLPDDFIMRRGEVGTECYLINRGTCMLCEYVTGNYEPPTPPMATEPTPSGTRGQRRSSAARVNVQSPFPGHDGGQSETEGLESTPYSRIRELIRGQSIGEYALLANYERSSDLRAVAYVEMCVIEREPFQHILTRHPKDRQIVVTSIVRHNMLSRESQQTPCPLMAAVQRVKPGVSVDDAIHYVSQALNPPKSDPSIVFGVNEELAGRVQRAALRAKANGTMSARSDWEQPSEFSAEPDLPRHQPAQLTQCIPPTESTSNVTLSGHNDEIMSVTRDIQERLTRLERSSPLCCFHNSDKSSIRASPRWLKSSNVNATRRSEPRREPALAVRVHSESTARKTFSGIEATHDTTTPLDESSTSVVGPRGEQTPTSYPPRLLPMRLLELPANSKSPSLYADQLYHAVRAPAANGKEQVKARRSSLRRFNSTIG